MKIKQEKKLKKIRVNKVILFSALLAIIVFTGMLSISKLKAESVMGANTVSSMGINPSILEVVLDKNSQNEQTIDLSNLTNVPIPIKVSKQSFTPKEKLQIPKDQLNTYDASSWITISWFTSFIS